MKKDDYLITAISVPPKQRLKIAPFDSRTQREAFSVSLEGLKGVRFQLSNWITFSLSLTVERQRTRPRIGSGSRGPEETERAQAARQSPSIAATDASPASADAWPHTIITGQCGNTTAARRQARQCQASPASGTGQWITYWTRWHRHSADKYTTPS